MKIRDIMTTDPQTCGVDADLATAARLMWEHDCGFLPVVAADHQVVGVLTDRDIFIASATRRLLPEQLRAGDVMRTPVRACLAADTIGSVLGIMKQFQVRRLPVVDSSGRLAGVVSMDDIVVAAERTKAIAAKEVVATLAGIYDHRRARAVAV